MHLVKSEIVSEFRKYAETELSLTNKIKERERVQVSNAAHNSLLKLKILELSEGKSFIATNEDYLMLNYCYLVSMLETRHRIWTYDYMAFSRRMGEVWENFCATCWELPNSKSRRKQAPNESIIRKQINESVDSVGLNSVQHSAVSQIINNIFSLTGKINLKLDMLSSKNDQLVGIDFKSGFGSNEKGNTERLLTVGKTYRYLFPGCQLYILVRQEENNNYLDVLRKSGVWDVYCGESAYSIINEITGVNIGDFVKNNVDFEGDLSREVFDSLHEAVPGCSKYLKWI